MRRTSLPDQENATLFCCRQGATSSLFQGVAVGTTLMTLVLLILRDSIPTFPSTMAAMLLTSGTSAPAWSFIAPNAIIVCIQLKKSEDVMISGALWSIVVWMAAMLISQRFFSPTSACAAVKSSNSCNPQRHFLQTFRHMLNMNPDVVAGLSRNCLMSVIQHHPALQRVTPDCCLGPAQKPHQAFEDHLFCCEFCIQMRVHLDDEHIDFSAVKQQDEFLHSLEIELLDEVEHDRNLPQRAHECQKGTFLSTINKLVKQHSGSKLSSDSTVSTFGSTVSSLPSQRKPQTIKGMQKL